VSNDTDPPPSRIFDLQRHAGYEDPPPNEIPTSPGHPLPKHDSLPAEMIGEAQTDRPPATLDEIRDLMLRVLDEPNKALEAAFESIGSLVERLDGLAARFETSDKARIAQAEYQDERLDQAIKAATDAGNGALEAVATVNALRDRIAEEFTNEEKARLAKAELRIDEHDQWIEAQRNAAAGS
jgi:hypothetical protein